MTRAYGPYDFPERDIAQQWPWSRVEEYKALQPALRRWWSSAERPTVPCAQTMDALAALERLRHLWLLMAPEERREIAEWVDAQFTAPRYTP